MTFADPSAASGSQLTVPDSFRDLYLDTRGRLTLPLAQLLQRAELCEDLAQQLLDTARHIHFDLGIAEEDVLTRLHAGLQSPESGLQPGEAEWVTARLAELLDWLEQLPQQLLPPTRPGRVGR
jgi:hypothetical protein